MAKKDLGRTPLEAGNTAEYHSVRREVRRRARHETKAFCRNATRVPEFGDALPAPVAPEHRRPGACWQSDMHANAIGPVKRWIHRQVGRLWDDVYSEIRARFDMRTLAGRHIVEQRLLQYVDFHGDREWRDLYVDEEGMLRERDNGSRRSAPTARLPVSQKALEAWLDGRKVGRRGSRLFWFVFTPGTHAVWREAQFYVEGPGLPRYETRRVKEFVPAYRQDRRLSRDEIAFYEQLPSWKRAEIAEDLAIEPVTLDASQRPYRSPFYRQPAPGAPPLVTDDTAA